MITLECRRKLHDFCPKPRTCECKCGHENAKITPPKED